jgi:hypothetical protein
MSHEWSLDAKFWRRALEHDEKLAEKTRAEGCRHCGGRLHRADYPRKPRGDLGDFEEAFSRRRSFSCGRCRRRSTPPSIRFLGRRVYVAQVVMIASLIWQQLRGEIGRRVIGVPRRTVGRWMTWWSDIFVTTRFWRTERSRFMPPVDEDELPRALVDCFGVDVVARTLAFLAPITTGSASWVRVALAHAEDGALS